jgi:hypothetical protein
MEDSSDLWFNYPPDPSSISGLENHKASLSPSVDCGELDSPFLLLFSTGFQNMCSCYNDVSASSVKVPSSPCCPNFLNRRLSRLPREWKEWMWKTVSQILTEVLQSCGRSYITVLQDWIYHSDYLSTLELLFQQYEHIYKNVLWCVWHASVLAPVGCIFYIGLYPLILGEKWLVCLLNMVIFLFPLKIFIILNHPPPPTLFLGIRGSCLLSSSGEFWVETYNCCFHCSIFVNGIFNRT